MGTKLKPRTKKQALQHILAELDAGRLGAATDAGTCVYEIQKQGKLLHCGVGCLFTPEQHKWIQGYGLNRRRIVYVQEKVGARNMMFMTGMNLQELSSLQHYHDECVMRGDGNLNKFRTYVVAQLEKA